MTDEVEEFCSEAGARREQNSPAGYEITISGTVHERWSSWFGSVSVTPAQAGVNDQEDAPPLTTFYCPAIDQAALRGLLNKLWDLNLDLVSVQRLPPD